jgi:peptidoglycan/LPS O-acetylase OafA/YrhL
MDKTIPPGLSLYLDVIRFGAAFVVLLSHVWPVLFPTFPLPWPGHEAVVVFFVLSGYVIAFATFRPGVTLGSYAMHRAVRILSVSVPAIALSIVIVPFVAGHAGMPFIENMSPSASEVWHATWINLLFLGESWSNNVRPPFNSPYWSLSFEVWYYVIFAAAVFTPRRWRLLAVLAAMAAAGPRILALFPIWLMGVWLYRSSPTMGRRSAFALFVLTALCAFVFYWSGASHLLRAGLVQQFPELMGMLNGANQIAGDLILGVLVTAHFAAARALTACFDWLTRLQAAIRHLASFTLSIYLFHMPLTVLIWNGAGIHEPWQFCALLSGGIFLLGSLTEQRNAYYRRLCAACVDGLRTRLRRAQRAA